MGTILAFTVLWYVVHQRHWLTGSIGFQYSRVRFQSAWSTGGGCQDDRSSGSRYHRIYRTDALRSGALPGNSIFLLGRPPTDM
jgi:hypothetical protein